MRLKDLIHETKLSVAKLEHRLDLVTPPRLSETQWNILRHRLGAVQRDLDAFALSLELNGTRNEQHNRTTRRRARRTSVAARANGFSYERKNSTSEVPTTEQSDGFAVPAPTGASEPSPPIVDTPRSSWGPDRDLVQRGEAPPIKRADTWCNHCAWWVPAEHKHDE